MKSIEEVKFMGKRDKDFLTDLQRLALPEPAFFADEELYLDPTSGKKIKTSQDNKMVEKYFNLSARREDLEEKAAILNNEKPAQTSLNPQLKKLNTKKHARE